MDTELLNVRRSAEFIQYAMEHDLQVKVNRSSALSLFYSSIARPEDGDVMPFGSEKFDKIATFLQSNDQQVHYASAANTVGVYAISRLLGELRRQVRDYRSQDTPDRSFLPMASPRLPPQPPQGPQQRGGAALPSGFALASGDEIAAKGKASAGTSGSKVARRDTSDPTV